MRVTLVATLAGFRKRCKSNSGGGTRTPDTRIMIPERVRTYTRRYQRIPLYSTPINGHTVSCSPLGFHLGGQAVLPLYTP